MLLGMTTLFLLAVSAYAWARPATKRQRRRKRRMRRRDLPMIDTRSFTPRAPRELTDAEW